MRMEKSGKRDAEEIKALYRNVPELRRNYALEASFQAEFQAPN